MNGTNFGLIGHPVGHTMSPFLHSRLFALCGKRASYRAEDIPPEKLAESLPRLRLFDGFNLTIPHKQAIIPLLDGLDEKAARFGSVNTVKTESGRMTGYTTDGEGFRRALEAAGAPLSGKIAVLGAGGAARAIVFEAALAGGGTPAGCEITVATREHSVPAAEKLCADIRRELPACRIGRCLISELRGERDLLVNATPLGMFPHPEGCAVGEDAVSGSACVFDAVYNPARTALLRLAERLGKKAVGGMGMLVFQAAAAEEIWQGSGFSDADLLKLCREAEFERRKKFGSAVLCGFMGSGKTTVGRLLAERTGRRFVDMDRWIEERQGRPVARIFAEDGEPYFRELEKNAAKELAAQAGLVIAAGGGALLDRENVAALRANGIVIFLDASLPAVESRLRGDSSRPLLRGENRDGLRRLYESRRETYRRVSDLTVPADGAPLAVAQAAEELLAPGGVPPAG